MKNVAIVANVAQLAAILLILFIRGLDLGVLVIFLLFFLMAVPFINFLSLFFAHHPLMGPSTENNHETEMIKREAIRIQYQEDHCPIFKNQPGRICRKKYFRGRGVYQRGVQHTV